MMHQIIRDGFMTMLTPFYIIEKNLLVKGNYNDAKNFALLLIATKSIL